MKHLLTIIAVLLATSLSVTADTGELQMTFKFRGDVPKPKPLELPAACGSLKMTDETLIASGNNKGVMNVVVYAYLIDDAKPQRRTPQRNKKLSIDCWNCRFVPRITLAQAGDTIKIRNMDELGYNVNLQFFKNTSQNVAMAPGRQRLVSLTTAEPTVVPIAANIFPWMIGYILVTDHPYSGVSDSDGLLRIRDLPAGKTIVFRAWHERGTFKNQIFINGDQQKWNASKFQVKIKPGVNDLGTIEIPGVEFGIE